MDSTGDELRVLGLSLGLRVQREHKPGQTLLVCLLLFCPVVLL